MNDRMVNPLGNLYDSFLLILKNLTIKYTGIAEENETLESKQAADEYIDAINKRDTFYTYTDYTKTELERAGITSYNIKKDALQGKIRAIPEVYHQSLLEQRRARCIDNFEETNNYYRMLNGYPDVNDTDYFYISSTIGKAYGIDTSIPIHKIQDYYNKLDPGKGDYYINIITGLGYLRELINKNPDKAYLKYVGNNRISIQTARNAKNFQIIQLIKPDVKDSLIKEFTQIYEQCREYFMTTIYIYQYRSFFDKYDNFMAMCIMLMTIQQVSMRQLSSYINRDFFDIYAVKTLYEAYDVPFDLNIDEDTQNALLRNLNMFIQNKATDKVIYDISYLLGFSNIKIYKYFLAKERKFDQYGVPIVKWKERFNTDTGEIETVPDYEAMYDLYFQKFDIRNDDFILSFNDKSNHVNYDDVVVNDPYWIEDQGLHERIWESTYNFVESKYLSVGVSYSITDILFENVLFLKLIMQKSNDLDSLTIKIPRITGNEQIPIFDVIIALLCLTSCKHNLYGEIITVPTQVISVLDYIKKHEQYDMNLDTLKFNYNYFFNPAERDRNSEMEEFKNQLIRYIKNDKTNLLANTFQFNFNYFDNSTFENEKIIEDMKSILSNDDYIKFRKYVDVIMQDTSTTYDKVKAINDIYANIKNLKTLLNYYLTKVCDNRRDYEHIKTMYDALFYSEEMSDLFTITGERTGYKRPAYTYFEFLYHRNPLLYNALFEVSLEEEYQSYIERESKPSSYTFDNFMDDVEYGKVFIDYSGFKGQKNAGDSELKSDKIYYYVNHIIGRLQIIFEDIEYLYMMNDTQTPLVDLLLRLVRFFKSYTVDIIDMDTLIVMDQKPENALKFFDEIYYIQKLIQTDENLRMSYSDVINLINSTIHVNDGSMKLRDQLLYEVFIYITNHDGPKKMYSLCLDDKVNIGNKTIQYNDENALSIINDWSYIKSKLYSKDDCKMKDKIARIWFE